METKIRIGVYRILRKMGLDRKEIQVDLAIKRDYFSDSLDWTCFLFFLESKFNLQILPSDEKYLETVNGVISYLKNIKLSSETDCVNLTSVELQEV